MRALTARPRKLGAVETMAGQFNERVGVASLARAVVVTAGASGERIERGAERRAADRVEETLDKDGAALSGAHFERASLHVLELLRLERLDVMRVSGVGTVRSEAAQPVGHRLIEQWPLLELGGSQETPERLVPSRP